MSSYLTFPPSPTGVGSLFLLHLSEGCPWRVLPVILTLWSPDFPHAQTFVLCPRSFGQLIICQTIVLFRVFPVVPDVLIVQKLAFTYTDRTFLGFHCKINLMFPPIICFQIVVSCYYIALFAVDIDSSAEESAQTAQARRWILRFALPSI